MCVYVCIDDVAPIVLKQCVWICVSMCACVYIRTHIIQTMAGSKDVYKTSIQKYCAYIYIHTHTHTHTHTHKQVNLMTVRLQDMFWRRLRVYMYTWLHTYINNNTDQRAYIGPVPLPSFMIRAHVHFHTHTHAQKHRDFISYLRPPHVFKMCKCRICPVSEKKWKTPMIRGCHVWKAGRISLDISTYTHAHMCKYVYIHACMHAALCPVALFSSWHVHRQMPPMLLNRGAVACTHANAYVPPVCICRCTRMCIQRLRAHVRMFWSL
jgi:hypothetical protein